VFFITKLLSEVDGLDPNTLPQLIRPTLCNRLLAASGHPPYSKGRYHDPQWHCTILRISERVSPTPMRRRLVRTVGQTMISHDLLRQDVHGVMTACVRFLALCTLPGDSEIVPIVILGVVGTLGPDQLRHHNLQTSCYASSCCHFLVFLDTVPQSPSSVICSDASQKTTWPSIYFKISLPVWHPF
jgi:hypothetical protein